MREALVPKSKKKKKKKKPVASPLLLPTLRIWMDLNGVKVRRTCCMLQFYIQYGVHITKSIGNKRESKGSFPGKPPKDIIVKRKKRRLDRVMRPRTRCHRTTHSASSPNEAIVVHVREKPGH